MEKKELGRWGEERAANYLKRRGRRILDSNYSCRFGEIDLIAEKQDTVAFVEVKMRKGDSFAQAREFVTAAKQKRIRATAALWIAQEQTERQPRFDVIEVYAPYGEKTLFPRIHHIENAFE